MRSILLFAIITLFSIANIAQTFTANTQVFYNLAYSSSAWADYNKDGYLDLLLVGIDGSDVAHSTVYKNNGNGTFTEQSFNLQPVYIGSVAWGDFNNDTYPDILLTGYTGSTNVTKIYKNNGGTSFTDQGFSLQSLHVSSVAWGDYNKDGFLDFAMCGWTGSNPYTKIFKNNGNNSFTPQDAITLTNVLDGTVEWGDYNKDGFIDLLVCGSTVNSGNGNPVSKIYKNNGNGTFTETSIAIKGLRGSTGGRSAVWGDYDKDGDLDLAIAGNDNSGIRYSKIYANNGNDSFTEQTNISLVGVSHSALDWGDYNGDGYIDLFLSGYTGTACFTKLYKNTGNGNFTDQTTGEPFTNVWMGSANWVDFDNNGKLDLFVSGQNPLSGNGGRTSKIFQNKASTPPPLTACTGTVTHGGKTYNTVKIGNQCWLKENLDIGTMIKDDLDATNNSVIEKYCYNNDANNCNKYGGLYQWAEALQYKNGATNRTAPFPEFSGNVQGICPTGWHIPTKAEGETLRVAVNYQGNALKAIGQGTVSGVGTNTSGFSALLAGSRGYSGYFKDLNTYALFWTTSHNDIYNGWDIELASIFNSINYFTYVKTCGLSIRCLKDATSTGIGEELNNSELPSKFLLEQNYPNPFNPTTKIRYTIASSGNVKLTVVDLLGKEVAVLLDGFKAAGTYEVEFNANGLSNGVYFYNLIAGRQTITRKLVLLK